MKGIGIERERESERESKILIKYLKPRNKAQTKVDYTKLSLEIITQNYRSVNYVAQKWVNYRDTDVSKKIKNVWYMHIKGPASVKFT